MGTIKAHIFKERQIGGREEVKIKLFDVYGTPINLSEDGVQGPEGPEGPAGPEGPEGPAVVSLPEHVNSETPHPVYDDGPSLTLLYANAKV